MSMIRSEIRSFVFLSWNVRGLNDPSKRVQVQNVILSKKMDIVRLKETKLSVVSNNIVKECVGSKLNSHA
jgi:exonuclease III